MAYSSSLVRVALFSISSPSNSSSIGIPIKHNISRTKTRTSSAKISDSLLPLLTSKQVDFHSSDAKTKYPFGSALDSIFVVCTSLALSFSLFVNPVSAFVVTTPRKLQSDELATVRLFQENTPSVVYITNLATKYVLALLFINAFLFLFMSSFAAILFSIDHS